MSTNTPNQREPLTVNGLRELEGLLLVVRARLDRLELQENLDTRALLLELDRSTAQSLANVQRLVLRTR